MRERHGCERLLELTLTLAVAVPDAGFLTKCLNKLARLAPGLEFIAVMHAGEVNGRLHWHVLAVAAGDMGTKETERLEVAGWRKLARAAGFGRVEGAAVRTLEGYEKYLEEGQRASRARDAIPPGTKTVFVSEAARRVVLNFGWAGVMRGVGIEEEGARKFRRWAGQLAKEIGATEDELEAVFIPRNADGSPVRPARGEIAESKYIQILRWHYDAERKWRGGVKRYAWHETLAELVRERRRLSAATAAMEIGESAPDEGWEQLAAREDPSTLEALAVE